MTTLLENETVMWPTELARPTNYYAESDNMSDVTSMTNFSAIQPKLEEEMEPDLINNTSVQIIFSMLYILIFILGIFGNFLVGYVVFRKRTMQTVTNFFITNLAVADILLAIFCLPFTPLYTFFGRWVFGTVLCHLVAFSQGCCVYLSTLTLTSIAIDRFFVIIYPFRPRMKILTCIWIIIVIWIVSILLTAPYAYYMQIEYLDEEHTIKICSENWPTQTARKIFGTVTTVLQFFLPFVIILFCYLCIFCKLKNNKRKLKKSINQKKKNNCEKVLKKKRSTNKMLVAMVFIFGLCWSPLNIMNVWEDFYYKINENQYYNVLFFFVHLVAMSSICYNAFLYSWLNESFKKEFKEIFLQLSHQTHHHNERKLFLNTKNANHNDDLKNGDMAETTFYLPQKNEKNANENHILIDVETQLIDSQVCNVSLKEQNKRNNFLNTFNTSNNQLIVPGSDEMTSSDSRNTSSTTIRETVIISTKILPDGVLETTMD